MHILFTILGMMAFGISNVIWKPLLPAYSVPAMLARRSLWTAGILILGFLLLQQIKLPPDWYSLLVQRSGEMLLWKRILFSEYWILVSLLGLFLFISSLMHQPAGVSGLVVCTSTSLSALLGWILNGEHVHVQLLFSFGLSLAGVLLLDKTDLRKFRLNRGLAFALLGACCWGYANIGFKKMIPQTGVLQFSMLQEVTVLLVSLAFLKFSEWRRLFSGWDNAQKSLMIVAISCCTILGVIFCNLGMSGLPVTLFALLVLAQPLTTFTMASLLLKERTDWIQKTGAAFILAGIYTGILA
jgi:drug/metabolite transporter (DMT)-like permease